MGYNLAETIFSSLPIEQLERIYFTHPNDKSEAVRELICIGVPAGFDAIVIPNHEQTTDVITVSPTVIERRRIMAELVGAASAHVVRYTAV